MKNKIDNLEDFVRVYEGKKTVMEISALLDIPLNHIIFKNIKNFPILKREIPK